MQIGQTIRFELFLGRCVDAVVRSVWHDNGLVKLRVEYGPGSFATILSDEVITIPKETEFKPMERGTDSDTYF